MGYVIPKAKNGVYFTKVLTKANFDAGRELLGWYFRNSVISKPPYYPLTNFEGMINFLVTNYPTYIESLGQTSREIERDKMITAMKNAAAKNYTDYPRPSYFINEIAKVGGKTTMETLNEFANDVGSSLVTGSRVLLTVMVIGGLLVGYLYLRPFLPKELKGSS